MHNFWTSGRPYLHRESILLAEIRYSTEWLNTHITEPSVVYAFEHYLYTRFSTNTFVYYTNTSIPVRWEQDICSEKNAYIVFTNSVETASSYWDVQNGIETFFSLYNNPIFMSDLILVHQIRVGNRWADIYKMNSDKSVWCKSKQNIIETGHN
jgi:hypothetical protein